MSEQIIPVSRLCSKMSKEEAMRYQSDDPALVEMATKLVELGRAKGGNIDHFGNIFVVHRKNPEDTAYTICVRASVAKEIEPLFKDII